MKRRKNRLLIWFGRSLLIFLGLIMLATLLFYIRRDEIKERALAYFNTIQTGELQVETINLIPFMNFPNMSVKAEGISYYEKPVTEDSTTHTPFLSLIDIYVSLDVIDLIRGDVNVTQARLAEGTLYLVQYKDSITNVEKALGPLLKSSENKQVVKDDSAHININLDKLYLSNITVLLEDQLTHNRLNFFVHDLRSNFSYLDNLIETGLEFNIDLQGISFLKYDLKKFRSIQFDSDLLYYTEEKKVIINPSMLDLSNTMLEVWGEYQLPDSELREKQYVDMTFRATNSGLDLLNFLFRGVLNIDDLEQVGEGFIYLSGSVKGGLGSGLPVIKVDCRANDLGFNVKSLQKRVSDISFTAFASNGDLPDLSEALIVVEDFNAKLPQGRLKADISLENAVRPEVSIDLDASLDMEEFGSIVNTEKVRDLKGQLDLKGYINGTVNKGSGEFLDNAGSMVLSLHDLGFLLPEDTVESIDGEIFLEENLLGVRDFEIVMNGNHLFLSGNVTNLLPYLYGFDNDLDADVSLESDLLYPGRLFKDTAMLAVLGDEIRGLKFDAGAYISDEDLDLWRREKVIPRSTVTLERFQTELSSYANIYDVKAELLISPDTLELRNFAGQVGESGFNLNATITDYLALTEIDSAAKIGLDYRLESDLMRAEDFFTFDGEFLLPETYHSEYLENFLIRGHIDADVDDLLEKDKDVDISVRVDDMKWNFRNYPLSFREFFISARKEGDMLMIDDFHGRVGESDLKMSATIGNIVDSTGGNLYGDLAIESDLLDLNKLLKFEIKNNISDSISTDTSTKIKEPPKLHEIDYPDFDLSVNIGELRYDAYRIFGMEGTLRSTKEKIFYLDDLTTRGEFGGKMGFKGHFYVANPYYYTLSANLDVENINITSFDIEMQTEQGVLTLEENFKGLLDATGMAEIVFTPDMKLDMTSTTAMFNVTIRDGILINFTPLKTAGRFLGTRDLDYVRFASLYNSFTLMDSRIIIPLMSVESTIGQLLIEGEQGFDKSYTYLLRVPLWLVRGAARNLLFDLEYDISDTTATGDDEIQIMKSGRFMKLTVWGDEFNSDMKLGDKRDKIQ